MILLGALNMTEVIGIATWILTIVIAVGAAMLTIRAKTGAVWKETSEAYKLQVDQRDHHIKELNDRLQTLAEKNAELAARPNIDRLYELMVSHDSRMTEVSAQIGGFMKEVTTELRQISTILANVEKKETM